MSQEKQNKAFCIKKGSKVPAVLQSRLFLLDALKSYLTRDTMAV